MGYCVVAEILKQGSDFIKELKICNDTPGKLMV
jgi:hypothetical protein